MSCLGRGLQLVGVVALVGGGAAAWLYRDRIEDEARRRWQPAATAEVDPRGRPSDSGLGRARDKIDSLLAWRADSVVLTAGEMASLIGAGLDPVVRGNLDSLEVELRDGGVRLQGLLRTAALPQGLLGPMGAMLSPWEPIAAGGPVTVRRPGWAQWRIDELELSGFPLPQELLPRLLESAIGGDGGRELPVRIPPGIGGVTVRRAGVTLYPVPPSP